MMKTDYQKEDKLISFLYPDTWEIEESYNKNKPNDWGPQVIDNIERIGTSVDKQKRRIPLRDLFISVSVISEAFKKATNVNDALEYIFDQIYEDSGNILNIKEAEENGYPPCTIKNITKYQKVIKKEILYQMVKK